MDKFQAAEQAYRNGFEAGRESIEGIPNHIYTRVQVAYEQLQFCYGDMCRDPMCIGVPQYYNVIERLQDIMNSILEVQVDLGMLKHKEDIK